MRIEVKYESSEGPHIVSLSEEELQNMSTAGTLTVTQLVGTEGNSKTTTITGSDREKWLLSQALLKSMNL